MKKGIISLVIFLFLPLYVSAWQRSSTNYEPETYEGGAQNWEMAQSSEGWLYFANNKGLLEFDGYKWSVYPMGGRKVRSLEMAGDRIYVGGSNSFGYFEKEEGQYKFKSLSAQLTQDWKGDIWNIFSIGKSTYFLDDYNIFIFENDRFQKVIRTDNKIDCSQVIGNKIYLGTMNGIYSFNPTNNLIARLPIADKAGKDLKDCKIVEILPYKYKIIAVTAHHGVYWVDNNLLSKFESKADSFLDKNQLFCASINHNWLVIGSVQSGALLLNMVTDRFEILNQSNILQNNTILSSFFDSNEDLWLGLDYGIAHIKMKGAISPLFSKESLIGTGYCSMLYKDNLYLGTNQGIYRLDANNNCSIIRGTEGQIVSLYQHDNLLFSCGDNGIVVLDGQSSYKIDIRGAESMQPILNENDKLIVATNFGFKIIAKRNGRWQYSHTIQGFHNSGKGFIIDRDKNIYWLANAGDNYVSKLVLDAKQESVQAEKYGLECEVASNGNFNYIENYLVLCTTNGLYRYSRITDKFIPFVELEARLGGKDYFQFLQLDKMNNIWFKKQDALYLLPYANGGYEQEIRHIGLESQMVEGDESIVMIDSVNAVIGLYKAFIKLRVDKSSNKKQPSKVYIRQLINSKDGSLIPFGDTEATEIQYNQNSINISWASFNVLHNDEIQFSYKLHGLDEGWSIPSAKYSKEYTNLQEGDYTFEVRVFSKGELQKDNIASVSFTILPPWYRSIWARIVYLLLFTCALSVMYYYISSRQKKAIKEKKKELELQRLLYEKENRLKDVRIHELEKEKLTSELQYKAQEMSAHILNLTQNNEILENIKKEAVATVKMIDNKESHVLIRRRMSKLISLVNTDTDNDENFDIFMSNFDLVHKDFFKILDENFPNLTRKEKILCAYIKMDLTSKEIAPLMNISVRGVEINRYNLRKKIGLDRNTGLSEFIQNIGKV